MSTAYETERERERERPFDLLHSSCRVVEYASYSDMKNAVRKLDGAELNGRRIRLYEDSRSRRKRYWCVGCVVLE